MKYLKTLGIAAVAAMAIMAFAAGSASATTLEEGGVTKNSSVTISASLLEESKAVLARTDGSLANECSVSNAHGSTTGNENGPGTYTGKLVTGPFTGHTAKQKEEGQKPEDGLSFSSCTRAVTVHDPGTLYVEHIAGTTDGDVFSEEAEVTVGSPFGTLNCKTGAGTTIGRLTGVKEGNATLDVAAVLGCGFLVPSATWRGTYEITTPSGVNGLGVSA